jgi:Fe-S cluster biogenesis protein NfuA
MGTEAVDALLERAEAAGDGLALDLARELLELYGQGLARLTDVLAAHDGDGAMARAVAGDELVSHLLLVHGLHPVPVRDRVLAALAEVRPYLESHGGDVELVAVEDGVARLRLQGTCNGCPSSTATLKSAIEAAVLKAAPDVERIEEEPPPVSDGLLQIELRIAPPGPCPVV